MCTYLSKNELINSFNIYFTFNHEAHVSVVLRRIYWDDLIERKIRSQPFAL